MRTRFRIRRVGVLKLATAMAIANTVVAAIVFVPFLLISALVAPAGPRGEPIGAIILVFIVIGLIFFAIVGWLFAMLQVALFNLGMGWVGGVEVEADPEGPTTMYGSVGPPPGYGYPQAGYGSPPTAPYGQGQPPQPPAPGGTP